MRVLILWKNIIINENISIFNVRSRFSLIEKRLDSVNLCASVFVKLMSNDIHSLENEAFPRRITEENRRRTLHKTYQMIEMYINVGTHAYHSECDR